MRLIINIKIQTTNFCSKYIILCTICTGLHEFWEKSCSPPLPLPHAQGVEMLQKRGVSHPALSFLSPTSPTSSLQNPSTSESLTRLSALRLVCLSFVMEETRLFYCRMIFFYALALLLAQYYWRTCTVCTPAIESEELKRGFVALSAEMRGGDDSKKCGPLSVHIPSTYILSHFMSFREYLLVQNLSPLFLSSDLLSVFHVNSSEVSTCRAFVSRVCLPSLLPFLSP
jgi:hypothetical protein